MNDSILGWLALYLGLGLIFAEIAHHVGTRSAPGYRARSGFAYLLFLWPLWVGVIVAGLIAQARKK